jgi:hypothetical protein
MKSVNEVATIAEKRINESLAMHLPKPSCAMKQQQWRWRCDEVKKELARRLGADGLGITVNVNVQ